VLAKWAANAPLALLDQYVFSLRRYRAIASTWATRRGCGTTRRSCTTPSTATASPNSFEVYAGTHTSKLGDRFQNHVMGFFSRSLCFEDGCP
jgi:hypothetical protein